MKSPKFIIDAYDGAAIKESRTTSNRAIADIIAGDFMARDTRVAILKLARIDQGVAVYDVLKTYDKGASDGR